MIPSSVRRERSARDSSSGEQDAAPRGRPATGRPLAFSIFGTHARRLGLARAGVGGGAMYVSIPFFVGLHVSGAVYALHFAAAPLLGAAPIAARDYIILDRYRVSGLTLLDRFNCAFCGYANGLGTLLNDRLDQLAGGQYCARRLRRLAGAGVMSAYLPALLATEILCVDGVYDLVVSRTLGMKRMSRSTAEAVLDDRDYAGGLGRLARTALRWQKRAALRLGAALREIESAWCPIKHFERRAGVIYPDHHRLFFEPDQIEQLRELLWSSGTVADPIDR